MLNCLRRMDLFTTTVIVYNSDSQILHCYNNLSMDPNIYWFHEDYNKVKTWILYGSGNEEEPEDHLCRSLCLPQSTEWWNLPDLEHIPKLRDAEMSQKWSSPSHLHKETQSDQLPYKLPTEGNCPPCGSSLLCRMQGGHFVGSVIKSSVVNMGFYTARSSCWQSSSS